VEATQEAGEEVEGAVEVEVVEEEEEVVEVEVVEVEDVRSLQLASHAAVSTILVSK